MRMSTTSRSQKVWTGVIRLEITRWGNARATGRYVDLRSHEVPSRRVGRAPLSPPGSELEVLPLRGRPLRRPRRQGDAGRAPGGSDVVDPQDAGALPDG